MLKISIDSKSYDLKTEDSDITLKEFIEFCNEVKIPDSLKSYYDSLVLNTEYKEVDELETVEWIQFYEKVFRFFLTPKISGELKFVPDNLINIYNQSLQHLVFKSLYAGTHSENAVSEFELNGKKYTLPAKYMANSKLGDYGEIIDSKNNQASMQEYYNQLGLDIEVNKLQNGNVKAYPYILGILYKEDHTEKFDTKKIAERASAFLDLNMDVVWGIDFFFSKLTETYVKNMVSYSQERNSRKENEKCQPTSDTIIYTNYWQKKASLISKVLRQLKVLLMRTFTKLLHILQRLNRKKDNV